MKVGGSADVAGKIAAGADRDDSHRSLLTLLGRPHEAVHNLVGGAVSPGGDADSAKVAACLAWWADARRYFETGDGSTDLDDQNRLLSAGIDPWIYSARGRPLAYVGSRECLSCHETLHREHSERWKATKFKSMERLKLIPTPKSAMSAMRRAMTP